MTAWRWLAILSRKRLEQVSRDVFDELGFLSPEGVRSLTRIFQTSPFALQSGGHGYRVNSMPGKFDLGSSCGNSSWRGLIRFPTNFLLIEALECYHCFYGGSFTIEVPPASGSQVTLLTAARALAQRLVNLFWPVANG